MKIEEARRPTHVGGTSGPSSPAEDLRRAVDPDLRCTVVEHLVRLPPVILGDGEDRFVEELLGPLDVVVGEETCETGLHVSSAISEESVESGLVEDDERAGVDVVSPDRVESLVQGTSHLIHVDWDSATDQLRELAHGSSPLFA